MTFHSDIRVLPRGYRDWGVAKRARRCYAVVLGLIVLVALVLVREVVLRAERLAAVLALEGQEVYEVAQVGGALLSDGEEVRLAFGGGGRRARHGGGSD